MSEVPTNESGSTDREEGKALNRRSFFGKGAAAAAGAALGAAGLSEASAEPAKDNHCRAMEVSFDLQGFSSPEPRAIMEFMQEQGAELVAEAIRNCPDDGGWGEWPRDASGDQEVRSIGFKHFAISEGR